MRRWAAIAAIPLLVLVGCGGSAPGAGKAREEIEALLGEYLPLLGEVYESGDPSLLEGLAAAREIAAIDKRLRDIRIEGRLLVPTFQSMTIEELKVWSYANAYVTTQEIWDIRTYATGSEQLLTEQMSKRDRVKYQLKRIDGRWMVLFRTILDQ